MKVESAPDSEGSVLMAHWEGLRLRCRDQVKPGEMKPTYVWSETKKIPNKEAIFTSLDDFQGYEFNVSFTSRNWTKSCCYRLESCPGPTTPWETR